MRAALDERRPGDTVKLGILREGRRAEVEITLDDGTKTTIELLPPGLANYMQIGTFPDYPGLVKNAEKAQDEADQKLAKQRAYEERLAEHAKAKARGPLGKIKDAVMGLFGKDKS